MSKTKDKKSPKINKSEVDEKEKRKAGRPVGSVNVSGIGRVGLAMRRIQVAISKVDKHLPTWIEHALPDHNRSHLLAVQTELKSIAHSSASCQIEVEQLELSGWKPKANLPVSFPPGLQVTVTVPDIYHLAPDDVLEVVGDGPVRGTVWICASGEAQIMVAKNHLARA